LSNIVDRFYTILVDGKRCTNVYGPSVLRPFLRDETNLEDVVRGQGS
jgi:hypothetical protein